MMNVVLVLVLLSQEKGMSVDMEGYQQAMADQKARSRGEGKDSGKQVSTQLSSSSTLTCATASFALFCAASAWLPGCIGLEMRLV